MLARARVVGSGQRVAVSAGVGALVGATCSRVAPWQVSTLASWDAAATVFLVWVWATIARLSADETRVLATREDTNRAVADLALVIASVGCLVGVGFTFKKASDSSGAGVALLVALAVLSVVASWVVVHTVFILRYARLYYEGEPGGVDFNDGGAPDFSDFAYLGFTIGMTYQVSDTNLSSRVMRRTALRHSLLSFVFGTFILAMTINVIAGLIH